jgi:hypothetical protein
VPSARVGRWWPAREGALAAVRVVGLHTIVPGLALVALARPL